MNGATKRRKLSTLIILQFRQKSNRGQRCYAHIRGLFWRETRHTRGSLWSRTARRTRGSLWTHAARRTRGLLWPGTDRRTCGSPWTRAAPRRSARRQRLLAVSALELVESPSVRSWSNPGPVLPVVVVAGVALIVNVDTSIFELLNKGVDVSNRYYAVV